MNTIANNNLLVIWQDNETRLRWVIGELSKENEYVFKYDKDNIDKLKSKGFNKLIAFPDWDKKYVSDILFSSFSSRLPDKRRSDIDDILKTYELDNYDEFELLRKSGGKLPTDSIEFVEPIDLSEREIKRQFYIAGVKFCCKNDCDNILSLEIGTLLTLELEPTNKFDENAVIVLNKGVKLGYVPSYFSREVTEAIQNKSEMRITIVENNSNLQAEKNCHECIKVELLIK